ncbi:glycosyltransferase family 9 protein [Caulobacter sp. S45]|uniref:glycosyltransferase family 9 protein n=1 Tax=Caulobacter sp. S45 TaxID=1641861 RepID=UPI0015751610|nr:glycosyltransferase family 9 protein [Caulobacter sp. S45]
MAAPRFPILFITASRVGDAVLSSGLIRRLADEMPHARFTIVASPLTAPLFRDTPNLDEVIALEKARLAGHWLKLWRQVRGRRWGLVVDMRGSTITRFLNARRRATYRPPAAALEPVHKVMEAARVLKLEDEAPAPYLFTNSKTEAAADALLAGGSGPILAIAPAANWAGKTWPAERFAVVAAELLAKEGPLPYGRLLLLGGPSDRFAAEAVRRVIPRARLVDTVGRIDLLTAYSLLKRARLFIGNDSGLMHLAAAAGAPTLGLFGPSDERLYAPWGANARVLRGPRDFKTFKAIDPQLNQVVCHMFDLPTPWVVAAARRLLEETAEASAAEADPPSLDDTLATPPLGYPDHG